MQHETIAMDLRPDSIASTIANKWVTWDRARDGWLKEKKELRQFLFATDARKTTVTEWKNSTVTPKLTQIRDNLHANYMAALFPQDQWFSWVADDQSSATAAKREAIVNYMKNKLTQDNFEVTVSGLVLDYIDYGNAFIGHEHVNEMSEDPMTGEITRGYKGPRAFRISPLDIVMDLSARTFKKAAKIVRTLRTTADFLAEYETDPNWEYNPDVVDKIKLIREGDSKTMTEILKDDGYRVDGFGSLEQYFNSGSIEILEMYGDFYDPETGELLKNHLITVVDRRWVLRKTPIKTQTGEAPIYHVGWRPRPDNLWAQGPLDQLLGLQWRIDHLENLKADVFDQIAHPVVLVGGTTVEDFEFGPGVKVQLGPDGNVTFARPDSVALNADMQIQEIMNKMEELAGAPRQAMGVRTPGEKTKYEVQVLENGAGRIFQHRATWFEKNLLEPALNSMLGSGLSQMAENEVESIRTEEDDGTVLFKTVSKQDLQGKGNLRPVGARHFAEKARFVQELGQTLTAMQQVDAVKPHLSGIQASKALEDALGWKKYKIFQENILIHEQAESQRVASAAQEQVAAESQTPSELQSEDFEGGDEIDTNEAQAGGPDSGGI